MEQITMDYEKLYKEALERMKGVLNNAKKQGHIIVRVEDIENYFPELKESEDERIRKDLIRFVKGYIRDETSEQRIAYLAWLEKQGNTIPDECVFRPVAGCDIESAAKQAIKQQGVLAKEIVLAFNGAYIPVKGKAADIIVNEYNSWIEKQGEQKPTAWSEEDENICCIIINDIETDKSMCKHEISKGVCDIQINWLKSLKERYIWKPNDEQMSALKNINLTGGVSYAGQGQKLIDLYNELKKLKGE